MLTADSLRLIINRDRRQGRQILAYPGNGFVVDERGRESRHGVEAVAHKDLHIGRRQTAYLNRRTHTDFRRMTMTADLVIDLLAAFPLLVIFLRLARYRQQCESQYARHQKLFEDIVIHAIRHVCISNSYELENRLDHRTVRRIRKGLADLVEAVELDQLVEGKSAGLVKLNQFGNEYTRH